MFLILFSCFALFSPLAYLQWTWNPFVGKTDENMTKHIEKRKSRVKCQQKFWEVEWSKHGNSCIGPSGRKGGDSKLISTWSGYHTIGTGKHDIMINLSHTTEIIILLFGNNSMALFSNHTPFSFAKKMIVIDIVDFFRHWNAEHVWSKPDISFHRKKNEL